jgi:hypothetical protein
MCREIALVPLTEAELAEYPARAAVASRPDCRRIITKYRRYIVCRQAPIRTIRDLSKRATDTDCTVVFHCCGWVPTGLKIEMAVPLLPFRTEP